MRETENIYKDIAKDVAKDFDVSGYSKDDYKLLPIGENKKVKEKNERWGWWKNCDRVCCIKG